MNSPPVRPHIEDASSPTWAEIWSFGDFLEAREQYLRRAGTFFKAEELLETERLCVVYAALRHAHHGRHARELDFLPPSSCSTDED